VRYYERVLAGASFNDVPRTLTAVRLVGIPTRIPRLTLTLHQHGSPRVEPPHVLVFEGGGGGGAKGASREAYCTLGAPLPLLADVALVLADETGAAICRLWIHPALEPRYHAAFVLSLDKIRSEVDVVDKGALSAGFSIVLQFEPPTDSGRSDECAHLHPHPHPVMASLDMEQPSPVQPSPAQPSPAQPTPAHSSPLQPTPVTSGSHPTAARPSASSEVATSDSEQSAAPVEALAVRVVAAVRVVPRPNASPDPDPNPHPTALAVRVALEATVVMPAPAPVPVPRIVHPASCIPQLPVAMAAIPVPLPSPPPPPLPLPPPVAAVSADEAG